MFIRDNVRIKKAKSNVHEHTCNNISEEVNWARTDTVGLFILDKTQENLARSGMWSNRRHRRLAGVLCKLYPSANSRVCDYVRVLSRVGDCNTGSVRRREIDPA